MSLRTRLLLSFVSIALAVLGLFGSVAYRIAVDSQTRNETALLETFAAREAAGLAETIGTDLSAEHLKAIMAARADQHVLGFITDVNGSIISNSELTRIFGDDVDAYPWTNIGSGETDAGRLDFGGKTYLWHAATIASLPYKFYLVHSVKPADLAPLKQLGTRLLVTAGIIIWIAAWGALILSAMFTKGIERKNREIEHRALHDALTELPNRTWLGQHMEQALDRATGKNTAVAVLVMDMDRFKEINDTLGHDRGDELLKLVVARLRNVIRKSDAIVRLGGDEFAIVMEGQNIEEAEGTARRILESTGNPFRLEQVNIDANMSIGIAMYPEHGEEGHLLIRRAEVAMYEAKQKNIGHAVYTPDNDPYNLRRLTLLGDLSEAVSREELSLLYQPKVDIASRRIIGAEALLRWTHPDLGAIAPGEFIPLAEHGGMIKYITLWVLNEALQQQAKWLRAGIDMSVAVNISAKNLQDRKFPQQLAKLLSTWHTKPEHLELEITESAVMIDPKQALEILTELHAMNVGLSIDDFGTGYSSLAYIKKLPIDTIKIDRSFVMDMTSDSNDAAIVRATIGMAHNLGLKVVAEGIETHEAWQMLAELACDVAQGYLISRPLSVEKLGVLLAVPTSVPEILAAASAR